TVSVRDTADAVELPLVPTPRGYGVVTVSTEHLRSDLYVTLSDGDSYTATHGRSEFVETYPRRVRLLLVLLGRLLEPLGRTAPAFARDQYAYAARHSRPPRLLLNISN